MGFTMNERIRELAVEAKIEFTYDPTEKPIRAFVECCEDELEKFAKLIVLECMELTKQCSTGKDIHDLFADEIIAEHFGVE
jgi:hypothetical protein